MSRSGLDDSNTDTVLLQSYTASEMSNISYEDYCIYHKRVATKHY